MIHLCHALHCTHPCERANLMCRTCWALVPPDVADTVYRTAKLRGPTCDATWAAWWRAQAIARAEVAKAQGRKLDVDAWLAAQLATAKRLEARVGQPESSKESA